MPEASKLQSIKTALVSIWLYLGTQAGISMVLSVPVGLISGFLASWYLLTGSAEAWLEVVTNGIMLICSVLSCLLVCLYALPKTHVNLKKQLTENRYKVSDLFFGVCAAYGLSIPLGLVTSLLSELLGSFGLGIPEVGSSGNVTLAGELIYFVIAVIAAPICEELIFRGIILHSLKKYSPGFAVVFSSLLFALAHMNLYQGIAVMGMGLVMGFLYLKTGSLQASIFIHFINNLIAVLSEWLPWGASMVLEVVLLTTMVIGWVYLAKNRSLIRRLASDPRSRAMWALTTRQAIFWCLVFLFALMSIFSILGLV